MAPATIECLLAGATSVRGGEADVVEGSPPAKTIVIVEFPSMARAREMVPLARICRVPEGAGRRAGAAADFRGRRSAHALGAA